MSDDRPSAAEIAAAERRLHLAPGTIVRRHDTDGWSWQKALATPHMDYSAAGRKGGRKSRWGSTFTLRGSHSRHWSR